MEEDAVLQNPEQPQEEEVTEELTKIKLEPGTLIYLFKQVGFDDSDIPTLLAIAQMESNMVHGAIGYNSESGYDKDLGILQLNNLANYDDNLVPDQELKVFFNKEGVSYSPEEFAEALHQDIMFQMRWAKHKIDWHRSAGTDPFRFWMTYPPIKDYIENGDTEYAPRQQDFDLAIKHYEDYKNNKIQPISVDVPNLPPIEAPQNYEVAAEDTGTVTPQPAMVGMQDRSPGVTNMFGEPPKSVWNEEMPKQDFIQKNTSQVVALIEAAVNANRKKKNLPTISNNYNIDAQMAQLTDDQKTVLDILRDVNAQ
jgi:hypothetical protein